MVIFEPRTLLISCGGRPSISSPRYFTLPVAPAVVREKAERGQKQLALARSGFADDAETFAFGDVETDALDGVHFAVRRRETHVEIADLKDHSRSWR